MPAAEGHQEYIQKKINPILENLVTQLLLERPEDPVPFMIQWLSDYSHTPAPAGIQGAAESSSAEVTRLQSEVDSLRAYVKQLESKQAELEAAASKSLPCAPSTTTKGEEDSADEDSSDEDDEEDVVDELPPVPANYHRRGPRASVSAEAYGDWNKKRTDFVAPVHPKSEEQAARIRSVLSQSFLFMSVDEKSLDVVIGAMVEKVIEPNQRVINQGDDGDVLYVVESGELDCYKKLPGEEEEKLVKTCTEGDTFGELALLYNTPRAASVQARGRCVVWQLDRETFNHIVKEAAASKREKYETFLKSVPLLESMDSYERSKVADALRTECFKAGECIVRQGDVGDKFYMLEEGECTVYKEPKEVMHIRAGDYFGELALLSNDPRAATVKAKTDCQVLSLDRRSFKRLLGPLEDILKRNTARYE
ncbi:cAMP-dependent protein kinase regulatory subunit, putative [Perkinsus marinus ATCC 50983]|uniref:cAMP-dependent protein kinase regulatory subunit n=1 Tax=Perkinsus marinus (strain ATCC 50983 / TXsc) TaxID=423536 RepID=C5M0Q0_PERM5|nr:cAMP-dependent protein kinase regulatory subunit, putative [Perkinsus marinus ATCC 50983]EEQ97408.1 cAMP-dependent protein kinase regulatory subunit, putative [Perkinsus marinus ATCC 50983]|eukprot:XP_002764691.1 cAMP-dependent protein kinase regulatory subunit, putative [Perkinsus marinus ATCC 50983]